MTAIVKNDKTGEIKALMKGADSIISARLAKTPDNQKLMATTDEFLSDYAKGGLRTLLIAEKVLSESAYNDWNDKYKDAAADLENKEQRIDEVSELLEVDFELIGSTAIEDKL